MLAASAGVYLSHPLQVSHLMNGLSVGQLYPPYFLVWGARAVYFGKYLTCLAPRLCFQVPSPEPRSSMIFSTRSEKAHIDPKFVAFEI